MEQSPQSPLFEDDSNDSLFDDEEATEPPTKSRKVEEMATETTNQSLPAGGLENSQRLRGQVLAQPIPNIRLTLPSYGETRPAAQPSAVPFSMPVHYPVQQSISAEEAPSLSSTTGPGQSHVSTPSSILPCPQVRSSSTPAQLSGRRPMPNGGLNSSFASLTPAPLQSSNFKHFPVQAPPSALAQMVSQYDKIGKNNTAAAPPPKYPGRDGCAVLPLDILGGRLLIAQALVKPAPSISHAHAESSSRESSQGSRIENQLHQAVTRAPRTAKSQWDSVAPHAVPQQLSRPVGNLRKGPHPQQRSIAPCTVPQQSSHTIENRREGAVQIGQARGRPIDGSGGIIQSNAISPPAPQPISDIKYMRNIASLANAKHIKAKKSDRAPRFDPTNYAEGRNGTSRDPRLHLKLILPPLIDSQAAPITVRIDRDLAFYHSPVLASLYSATDDQLAAYELRTSLNVTAYLFCHWIYKQSLFPCPPETDGTTDFVQMQLVDLYLLAERLQVPTLQNETLHALAKHHDEADGIALNATICLYQTSPNDSMLRRFFVWMYATQEDPEEMKKEMGKYPMALWVEWAVFVDGILKRKEGSPRELEDLVVEDFEVGDWHVGWPY